MFLKRDISFSAGVHVAIFLACMILAQKRAAELIPPPPPLFIEIEELSSSPQKREDAKTRQVVRTRQVDNQAIPQDEAFLGERNQTVDRQTVSKNGGAGAAGGARSVEKSRNRPLSLSSLGVAVIPPVSPSHEALSGDGHVREYISGLKEGEETALSTKEYLFYGYFERIRDRLDRAWEPILREHLTRHYRQGRRLASEMDHRTEVLVVLDNAGTVVHVEIVGESGTETLDAAAVQAFNRAGPFPNPPRGLVDRAGTVKIKWEFILKT
ncbi:MAG: energy transducer TonB [Bdellovibrionales bacterium]|nr:energy transducer TonB [Bdellovibrionales bacterium]